MEADLSRRFLVLRREFLFQGLEPAQLSEVARAFEENRFAQGEAVFFQGDDPDNFYIILEGRARVVHKEGSRDRQINLLGPGDYFGEQALLFESPRTASVYAESPLFVLWLNEDKFQTLLETYPQIRLNLAATAQSRSMVHHLNFSWLHNEEVIYYITRRHPLFLALPLVWPALIVFVSLVIWLLMGAALDVAKFLAIPMVIAIGWGAWIWVDWSNDYYIVTNQRVVWQEKVIMLYDSRQEAPLNTVLSVNTTTSWLGRILEYGDAEVRTFTGAIHMKKMSRPYLFASFVEGYRKRVQALSSEREDQELGNALYSALLKSVTPPELQTSSGETSRQSLSNPFKATSPRKQATIFDDLKKAWDTFLKVRYQEGNVITYRKHYLLLLKGAGVPFLINLFIIFGIGWSLIGKQFVFTLVLFFLLLVAFVWLVYEYMDWSNDIYRLTPEQIMDIEKKPLGREQKTTSNLDAPDFRVEHIRKNIINIIFNYGNVIVNVGETKFTFDGVYNPNQVHQDVANYRAALQRKKQEDLQKSDRERMIKLLVTYHQQSEKLENPENPVDNG